MSEKIASIIKKRYQKTKELSQDVFDKIEISRNLYKNILNVDDSYEWEYSLTDSHTFPLIRNYLSRVNPSQVNVRLDARRPDVYEKRQVNQDFVNWELGEIYLTQLFYRIYFSGFMCGKGFAKDGWKYEPALKIKTPRGEEMIMREIINRADAKFVRFNDLLIPNRNIPTIYEQPYLIEMVQKRVGEMLDENRALEEKGEKEYWDKKWLKQLRDSGVSKKLLDYQIDFAQEEDSKEDFAYKSAYVSLICMKTLENDLIYIPLEGDERIVNTVQENPYWHGHYDYIEFTPFPEDDEFYSMSIVDSIADLQIAATEVLNQNLTNIRKLNNSMWIAGTSAAQTPDWQFQDRPDGIIRVAGDVNQIQQIRGQDNSMASLRVSQDLQNRIERAGGISSLYMSGVGGSSINQTARGAQIIDQNIDTNIRMVMDLFGEQVIKTMGEHFLELNAQFITEEQTFAVTGKKGMVEHITLEPSMISANFDVSVNAERMTKQTPASRQASLQNMLTVLTQFSNQQGVILDFVPGIEALIDAYPEMDNVDDMVISIDEKAKRDIATLERGQEVEVKVRDPHMELIQMAKIHYEDNNQMYPEEVNAVFGKYFVDHTRFMQSQKEIQMMAQPTLPQMSSPDRLIEQANNSEQMGLPENEGTYNLQNLVPEKSEI